VYEFNLPSAASVFRPKPGHHPRNRQEQHKRVHRYVSLLGNSASVQLQQSILKMRNAAEKMPTPQLQAAASKEISEEEFRWAIKELLCLWIHLEAVDQGGAGMPTWLINYLKLALYATDYLVAQPTAAEIMKAHAHCENLTELYSEVSESIAKYLGLGDCASSLGIAFVSLLTESRALRQNILKDSLTADVDDDETIIQ